MNEIQQYQKLKIQNVLLIFKVRKSHSCQLPMQAWVPNLYFKARIVYYKKF